MGGDSSGLRDGRRVGPWPNCGGSCWVLFSIGVVKVKLGQSSVWVPPSTKQIGHHRDEEPCPVNARA